MGMGRKGWLGVGRVGCARGIEVVIYRNFRKIMVANLYDIG